MVERPGKEVLCWSSGPDQWRDTEVPLSLKVAIAKRPASSLSKKPASRPSTAEEVKKRLRTRKKGKKE